MKKLGRWAAAMAWLVCACPLRAHHSISMIDVSTPVWVKGTVALYEPVNPHVMIALDERTDDGQVRRWTVEGPSLTRRGSFTDTCLCSRTGNCNRGDPTER